MAELAANAAQETIRRYRQLDRAPTWDADTAYVVGDIVAPTRSTDTLLYRCTTAGTSDDEDEPTWPDTEDETVTDGTTLVWTAYVRPFETQYAFLAFEMGVYLYTKHGVDGVTAFSENGVQRTFEKGSFPPSMVARITLPSFTG